VQESSVSPFDKGREEVGVGLGIFPPEGTIRGLSPIGAMKSRNPGYTLKRDAPRRKRASTDELYASSPVTPINQRSHAALAVNGPGDFPATAVEFESLPEQNGVVGGTDGEAEGDGAPSERGSLDGEAEPALLSVPDRMTALRAAVKQKKRKARGVQRGAGSIRVERRSAIATKETRVISTPPSGRRKVSTPVTEGQADRQTPGRSSGGCKAASILGSKQGTAPSWHSGSEPGNSSDGPSVLAQRNELTLDSDDFPAVPKPLPRRRRLVQDSEDSDTSESSMGVVENMDEDEERVPIPEPSECGSSSSPVIPRGSGRMHSSLLNNGSHATRQRDSGASSDMARVCLPGLRQTGDTEDIDTDDADSIGSTPVQTRSGAARGIFSAQFPMTEDDEEDVEDADTDDDEILDADKQLAVNQQQLRQRGLRLGCASTIGHGEEGFRDRLPTAPPLTLEETWVEYINTLREDFLSRRSPAASMRDKSPYRSEKGVVQAYHGLILTEDNNEDVRFVFKARFEPKHVRGQPLTSYLQLRICVGQFVRFCVVYRVLNVEDVWKPGSLFRAVGNLKMVKLFISSYQLRASPCTVLTKGIHLKTIALHGEDYFRDLRDGMNRSLCE
jgi:hypothetical protein